ncbi:MAG: amino acid permease [Chloroflexota bacterium]
MSSSNGNNPPSENISHINNVGLERKLSLFDVTNLVVGAIIGADIYVASSFGAASLGPFSLVVWVIAGLMAMVIALCFAQCAALVPEVGGPYAYAKQAWGSFIGFIVGWSLWFAELISLAVFPLAFNQYLAFFFPILLNNLILKSLVIILFVVFLASINIFGIRAAGKTNDVLTIAKLAPLVFFSIAGIAWIALNPSVAQTNYSPILPSSLSNLGPILVLIFWAYAGFEISTIPSSEVSEPEKTIPKAIVLGLLIVISFYLTTNIILFGVRNWKLLGTDTAPLASATTSIFSSFAGLALIGALIVGIGALVSVTGSDESGALGTSRLGYALGIDGLFPKLFAKIHPKYKTPYMSIIIQSMIAAIAALIPGSSLRLLIAVSVFFMAIAYLATSTSIFVLRQKRISQFQIKGGLILAILGIVFSIFLISQCSLQQIGLGVLILLIGIPVYVFYSPKKELSVLKRALLSRPHIAKRLREQERRFLANILRHIKEWYRRMRARLV